LFKGIVEKVALINSGITENIIDQDIVKRLKLEARKLDQAVKLRNIDETYNQSGGVTHFIDLIVSCRG